MAWIFTNCRVAASSVEIISKASAIEASYLVIINDIHTLSPVWLQHIIILFIKFLRLFTTWRRRHHSYGWYRQSERRRKKGRNKKTELDNIFIDERTLRYDEAAHHHARVHAHSVDRMRFWKELFSSIFHRNHTASFIRVNKSAIVNRAEEISSGWKNEATNL